MKIKSLKNPKQYDFKASKRQKIQKWSYKERGPTAMALHVKACGQAWTLKQTYPNYWTMNQSNNTQHIASKFYPFSTVFAKQIKIRRVSEIK